MAEPRSSIHHSPLARRIRLIATCLAAIAITLPVERAPAESRQELLLEARREKARELVPYHVSKGERRVLWLETSRLPQKIFVRGWHGFRPLIGGAPQGAGILTGGVGYTHGLDSERFLLRIDARTSTNGYQIVDAHVDVPTSLSGSPLRGTLDASWRDLKRVEYFGIGNATDSQDAVYRSKESWVGGGLAYTDRRFEIGTGVRWQRARALTGEDEPRVEDVFDPTELPGFGLARAEFLVVGGQVTVNILDGGFPPAGIKLTAGVERFDDQDDLFDFTRVTGAVIGYLPLGYRNRVLATRVRTSHATPDRGQGVPFYFLEGIGGSRTLRGFESNRFRDRRNLVLNTEYRWEVWTYTDFAFFYDAGAVYAAAREIRLADLHDGYGFGIRVHSPAGGVFRWDFAHGDEGFAMHLSMGSAPFFNE